MNLLGVDKENACMIGDQIFTDIWGANVFGIMSILVRPFDIHEEFWVRLKRPIENLFLDKDKRR